VLVRADGLKLAHYPFDGYLVIQLGLLFGPAL
jgi:hypothetical protein